MPRLSAFDGTVAAPAALQRRHYLSSDADSVVRRVPLFLRVGETQLPSLVAEVSRVGRCARGYRLQVDEGSGTQQAGAEPRESAARGKMWVDRA